MRWNLGAWTANISGSVLAMILVGAIVLGLWLIERHRSRGMLVCWVLAFGVGAMLMVGTVSRGALLALVFGGLLLQMARPTGPGRCLPTVSIMGVVLLFLAWPQGMERWRVLEAGSSYPGVATRLHLWYLGALIAVDHPLGVGSDLATYLGGKAMPPSHLGSRAMSTLTWTLNDVMEVFARWGIAVGVALGALWGTLVALAWHNRREWHGLALLGMLLTWFVAGMISCVWWADIWYSSTASVLLLGLAVIQWRPALRSGMPWWRGAVIGGAIGMLCWCALVCVRLASDVPRFDQVTWSTADGRYYEAWQAVPVDRQVAGTIWWVQEEDPDPVPMMVYPLRCLANEGWRVIACHDMSLIEVAAIEQSGPHMVLAYGSKCYASVDLWSRMPCVLCQADPSRLPMPPLPDRGPALICWGTPDAQGHDQANAAWCTAIQAEHTIAFTVGRLWLNRFPHIAAGLSESLRRLLDRPNREYPYDD